MNQENIDEKLEEKHFWYGIRTDGQGERVVVRIYRDLRDGIVKTFIDRSGRFPVCNQDYLTESEIRSWGYNPDMFSDGIKYQKERQRTIK